MGKGGFLGYWKPYALVRNLRLLSQRGIMEVVGKMLSMCSIALRRAEEGFISGFLIGNKLMISWFSVMRMLGSWVI